MRYGQPLNYDIDVWISQQQDNTIDGIATVKSNRQNEVQIKGRVEANRIWYEYENLDRRFDDRGYELLIVGTCGMRIEGGFIGLPRGQDSTWVHGVLSLTRIEEKKGTSTRRFARPR